MRCSGRIDECAGVPVYNFPTSLLVYHRLLLRQHEEMPPSLHVVSAGEIFERAAPVGSFLAPARLRLLLLLQRLCSGRRFGSRGESLSHVPLLLTSFLLSLSHAEQCAVGGTEEEEAEESLVHRVAARQVGVRPKSIVHLDELAVHARTNVIPAAIGALNTEGSDGGKRQAEERSE